MGTETETAMELARCPLCGEEGAVKAKGRLYAWGCLGEGCPANVDNVESESDLAKSWKAAEKAWNEWAGKMRAAERVVAEGEEPAAEEEPVEEEPETPEEPAEPEDAGEEDTGEDAGERYARFELVVDGTRYECTAGEDGCAGCAFCLPFGKREICAIENQEDASPARHVCAALQGQWHESENDG